MPSARLNSSKPIKSKASRLHLTSKSKSSSSDGSNRFSCRAWWCDSTFSRRADMIKHVNTEHFGKRWYCTICLAVMKQESNLNTHLNAHLSNYCTVCSCGLGFTDPSAYTRHRESFGHPKGATHGKIRPMIIKGIKIQHIAGTTLNYNMISHPSFVPPLFDTSYHLKGRPKSKGQEKYDPNVYIESPSPEATNVPNVQITEPSSIGGTPIKYQAEPPVPVQTKIQVEELGIDANYSYDVELPQEALYDQASNVNANTEYHSSLNPYPFHDSQISFDHHFIPPGVVSPHSTITCHLTGANQYPQQYQTNFPVAIDNCGLPQPFAEFHVQSGYWDTPCPSQASHQPPWSMSSPSFVVPSQHNLAVEMELGMRVQNLPPHFPQANFDNQAYHPALVACKDPSCFLRSSFF